MLGSRAVSLMFLTLCDMFCIIEWLWMPDGLAAPSEENTGICLSQFKRLSRKFGQDVCLLELSSHDATLMTCPPGCCSNNLKKKELIKRIRLLNLRHGRSRSFPCVHWAWGLWLRMLTNNKTKRTLWFIPWLTRFDNLTALFPEYKQARSCTQCIVNDFPKLT